MSNPVLLYLSAARIPGNRAISVQQMRMCEAFQQVGFDVELIHPSYVDRHSLSEGMDIWSYYGIGTRFRLRPLPSLMRDGVRGSPLLCLPRVGGLTMALAFFFDTLRRHLAWHGNYDRVVIYSRNIHASYVLNYFFRRVGVNIPHFYEMHRLDLGQWTWLYEQLLPCLNGVVAITKAVQQGMAERFALSLDRLPVEPDGVNLGYFNADRFNMGECRKKLGLPPHPIRIVGYAGHLYPGRGVEELLQAARQVDRAVLFVLVGGHPEDVDRLCKLRGELELGDRVKLVGHVPPATVPAFLSAFDVLVAPYTSNFSIARYTSPLKIFEYMAARKPIVVGHLPVLDEVLIHEHNCIMVQPGNVESLAAGLNRALADHGLADRIASNAHSDVRRFTWCARAERIRDFMKSRAGCKSI